MTCKSQPTTCTEFFKTNAIACTPHRPIEAGGEQFAFSDSARPSLSEPRFADSVALSAAVAARLAGTVLATAAGAGNIRGSDATPRHHLPGCGLDAGRRHQGLSPNRRRLRRSHRIGQVGVRATIATRCSAYIERTVAGASISNRSRENGTDL